MPVLEEHIPEWVPVGVVVDLNWVGPGEGIEVDADDAV